ncbi:MAG: nucleotidyltransferase domain-containing protein [Chitinivibrionales bacterium]|nr:nucleotidyltransferase domain-containing protein [Chitinivibrionales bacterium]
METTVRDKRSMIMQMRDVIVQTVNPVRIILFGSFATGKATPFSDVDFLVIEDTEFGAHRSRRKEAARIWAALLAFDMPKDILVYTEEGCKKARGNPNHVVEQAMKYGQVIYERT